LSAETSAADGVDLQHARQPFSTGGRNNIHLQHNPGVLLELAAVEFPSGGCVGEVEWPIYDATVELESIGHVVGTDPDTLRLVLLTQFAISKSESQGFNAWHLKFLWG
jgi:hypothetical protein